MDKWWWNIIETKIVIFVRCMPYLPNNLFLLTRGAFKISYNLWWCKIYYLKKIINYSKWTSVFLLFSDTYDKHYYGIGQGHGRMIQGSQVGSSEPNYQDLVPSTSVPPAGKYPCPQCNKAFASLGSRRNHVKSIHDRVTFSCVCGKVYVYESGLAYHKKFCPVSLASTS